MDDTSYPEGKANGSKSPTRNGDIKRPDYDRNDTTQSGWATENEDEKVCCNHPKHLTARDEC
jgi:phosphatidate cytidylyltransferase